MNLDFYVDRTTREVVRAHQWLNFTSSPRGLIQPYYITQTSSSHRCALCGRGHADHGYLAGSSRIQRLCPGAWVIERRTVERTKYTYIREDLFHAQFELSDQQHFGIYP